jgi:hypothetical protein
VTALGFVALGQNGRGSSSTCGRDKRAFFSKWNVNVRREQEHSRLQSGSCRITANRQ